MALRGRCDPLDVAVLFLLFVLLVEARGSPGGEVKQHGAPPRQDGPMNTYP